METRLIKASGPSASPLMIVGDYATGQDSVSGKCFTGKYKHTLDILLKKHSLSVEKCYHTLYIKCPIPGYESKQKKKSDQALQDALSIAPFERILAEEIRSINPNAILALGELALNILTGEKSITKFRGSILPIRATLTDKPVKVVPMLHPRKIFDEEEVPLVYSANDVARAIRMSKLHGPWKENSLIWICKTYNQLQNWYERARHAPFLTYDVETRYNNFILCVGFCHDGYEAISIPILLDQTNSLYEKALILKFIANILKEKKIVNQNVFYDASLSLGLGLYLDKIIDDTVLRFHTLYPELPKNLGFQTSIYTDIPYFKDEGKEFNPAKHSVERLLNYNAKDCLATWRIYQEQEKDLVDLGLKDFYYNKVWPTFWVYSKINHRGLLVDDTQRKKLYKKYKNMLFEKQYLLNQVNGKPLNVDSNPQVGKFVYELLGCPIKSKKTPTGKDSYLTDEKVLEELWINELQDPTRKTLLRYIIFCRKILNILEFLARPLWPDGTYRTSYNSMPQYRFKKEFATESGRTSGGPYIHSILDIDEDGDCVVSDCGGSFQVIPKHGFVLTLEDGSKITIGNDIRTIFIPRPGYCFVEGDQAQAEDRVVAVLSEDWDAFNILNKKIFKRNKYNVKDDRHVLTAMLILSKDFEEITEDDRQNRGKRPRHAGNYDMSAAELSHQTHLPYYECVKIMEEFHKQSSKIRGIFHAGIQNLINSTQVLRTPHGRRRDFFGRVNRDMYKKAYSYIPQSTVSDHTKFSILTPLDNLYKENEARALIEAHDGTTHEVRLNLIEDFARNWNKCCATPISFKDCSLSRDYELVIPGELKFSETNLGEMKDLKL